MRHFKVDFNWKKIYNSTEFDFACDTYDKSPIMPDYNNLDIDFKDVYTSHLSRTNETAESLGLKNTTFKTDLLNEVPMKSFTESFLKIPTTLWFIIGRIQWYFNINRQTEGKQKTEERINEFINIIEHKKQNCLVIGHGFYFSQMKKTLKKNRYSGSNTRYYKNGQIIEFMKKSI